MDADATTRVPAIETCGLGRSYGATEALVDLALAVPRGICFALLGPNGAGKTTAVRLLSTLLRPSRGQARVLGHDVVRARSAVRAAIGIVFQEPSLDPQLTPREHLDLSARLYRIRHRLTRVDALIEGFGLADYADRPVRALSGGLRRRLEIARGILHTPSLLFLDEPTVGLDVAARAAVWDRLREMRALDTTLFLTTHSMEEAEALADRVGILDRGHLIVDGAPRDLKAELGGDSVWFRLERHEGARTALAALPGVVDVRLDPGSEAALHVTVREGPRRLADLVEAARPYGIVEVELQRPTLEQVFLHHTGRSYAVADASEPAG
jgi:ABC-2 type transport system ATP-binding protein